MKSKSLIDRWKEDESPIVITKKAERSNKSEGFEPSSKSSNASKKKAK